MIISITNFVIGFLFLCIMTPSAVSAVLDQQTRTNQTDKLTAFTNPATGQTIAYTIVLPGKAKSNGQMTPAKIYQIPQVPLDEYSQHSIHIKTKDIKSIAADGTKFHSPAIQSSISGLNIRNIRAPFEDFATGKMKNIDKEGIGRIYEVFYDSPVDPYDICRELMKNPEVEYAVPVFIYQINFRPDDPAFIQQWGVRSIRLEGAWDITHGSPEIIIANVDTGTDWDHDDLADNIWMNPNEIADNGIDDDGNGFIDDVRGWDFVGNVTLSQALSGQFQPDNNPSNDANLHGTHTGGLAAAVTNNGIGIAGTGFNCTLMPVKTSSDNPQAGGVYQGYEAILYAARMGAHVINCSWGGTGFSPVYQDIINQATGMGSLVVAASGNDGINNDLTPQYPANYDNVLSVGASTSSNRPSGMSNFGLSVSVYAPGENILSTIPNNRYTNLSGTSMSSPLVAGVAGLVQTLHPFWTPKQVLHQIRSTVDPLSLSDESLRPSYYGKVNATRAVEYNLDESSPQVPGMELSGWSFGTGDALTDYTVTEISLDVTNYLSVAENLNVRITPIDNYLAVTNGENIVGDVGTMETASMSINVQLLDNNPWYYGTGRLLVTFESGDYTDYQIINVPIRIPSSNRLTTLNFGLSPFVRPQWHTSSSPSADVYWSVGESGAYNSSIYFRKDKYEISFAPISTSGILYCIYAFDEGVAIAGSGNQTPGPAAIYSTADSGATWNFVSVGSITGFVNDIYFYDDQNGIFLGDPYLGGTGVGYTTDGGLNWNMVTNLPQWLTDENGYVGSIYYMEDNIWFGTSQGRVYRSRDRGQSWTAHDIYPGGNISFVAFKDENNGMAVYSESRSQGAPRLAATTSDGGETWALNQFEFTANGLFPVYLFSPKRSDFIAVLYYSGEVFTTPGDATTWTPILSVQSTGAMDGTVFSDNGNARLWQPNANGTRFSYLDFTFEPVTSVDSRETDLGFRIDNISPNPAAEESIATIYLGQGTMVDIGIYKSDGNLVSKVYTGYIAEGFSNINLSTIGLSSGIYYVYLKANGKAVYSKLVVAK